MRQVYFEVCLEAWPTAGNLAGYQAPQPAIGENAKVKAATIQVPFDLLRWVFTGTSSPSGSIQTHMPRLGIGN